MKDRKLKIIFICRRNSCRSQMAEGWARKLRGDMFDAYSAGLEAGALDPRAVEAMREAGVDISGQKSKQLDILKAINFDLAVTVCGAGEGQCPAFAGGAARLHAPFDDPPLLARGAKTEEEAWGHYRRVRDEIKAYVENLSALLRGRAWRKNS